MSTDLLASIPSPPQGVWMLGPLPIRAYALCIIVGILVAIWVSQKRYAARGGDPQLVGDTAIVVVIAGIIGGRLYHVITDHQKYFCDTCNPVDALKITNGGLGIWGAVALGAVAVYVFLRIKGVPFAPFADAVAPAVILAQAIGRLGNWFNQELYGGPTDLPWGLELYQRVNDAGQYAPLTGRSTGEIIAVVHPTFLYEIVWNLLVFAVLLWADRRFRLGHGRVFALYVAGYCLGRFFIEHVRVDEATMIFGLRVNIIVSAVVFIVAVVSFVFLPKGRESEAEVRGEKQTV
ncbi:Prolipoprotein diacylglyceryl transferase [Corynebacterium pseudopelargi]|uniref:Phosphatidylglycerol--prolipoprotein diacylglyceryl transferase n=2 Tax=Corynebacterium pseudopelargi TaxID=2080757 RepID=A0A3G6ITL9_9CORY|nr:Prolipoprotein diacylglyceryl transferase [Corynebacterium pseudopelargi]